MADKETNRIVNPRENNKTNRQKREKEQKQIKMLKIFGFGALALAIIAVIVGIVLGIVNKPSRKIVATVGEDKITLEEYQEAVRLQRSNINSSYQQYQQIYAMFGMEVDETTRSQFAYQMSDAYKGILGQQVLSNMIDQRIMAYGAAQEGITVSDEEVETYYQSMFGYYPNGTPTAAPTSGPFEATPTVSDEQLAILRYTETPLPTEIPTEDEIGEGEEAAEETAVEAETAAEEAVEAAEETAVEAETAAEEAVEAAEETAVEAETAAEEAAEAAEEAAEAVEEAAVEAGTAAEEAVDAVEQAAEDVAEEASDAAEETAQLVEDLLTGETEPTEEPTPFPTATLMSEETFKQYESYYFANNYFFSRDYMKKVLGYQLLQNKVEEKLAVDIPFSADMVWARHILVETEEEAQAALDRINAGEEWGDVCAEVSLDSTASDGGDLGWFAEGRMVSAFNDAAFAQEVGTISEPVQTDYGWHLIQVIAHEEHPYTSTQYDDAVSSAYQEWLNGYSEQLDVDFIDIKDLTPTDPSFVG